MPATARQINEADIQGIETHGAPDPAQSSIDIAANQMESLVNGIHDAITGPASRLRDRIDGVIRNTTKRRTDLLGEIDRFRNDGNSAIHAIGIMSEGCDTLIEHMGEALLPSVTHISSRRQRLNEQD